MSKRLTTEEFISQSVQVHTNKYDYSKVDYKNSHTKVCIICPEHGEFWQMPYSHLQNVGCPKCGIKNTILKTSKTSDDFIKDTKLIHGDKYDYSKVSYINNRVKVCIICPIHGEFHQTPHMHLSKKSGCAKCVGLKPYTTEEYIKEVKLIHTNKYEYSKVEYVNSHTKVCIICPEHGEFWQMPYTHLQGGGCDKCVRPIHDTDSFIIKAIQVHGDKYDYFKVKYIDYKTKVCIICPIHGEFWQHPSDHLKTNGCAKCGGVAKYTTEEFIEMCRLMHGDKYAYSKVKYNGMNKKICIVCPEHGDFYQNASSHLQGCGCPICNESHLEKEIASLLNENNIIYERQKHFKWLGRQSLDFYLPDYQISIECQGEQHFEPVNYFGGEKKFKYMKELDIKKNILCKENNMILLYYVNIENINADNYTIYNSNNLFSNKEELIETIANVKIYKIT